MTETPETQNAFRPLTLPPDIGERIQKLCNQKDSRMWEWTEDPRKTLEDHRESILSNLKRMGIDSRDHSRALGHILYETDNPRVLASIDNQLGEVVRGYPNPLWDLPAHEGMEKLTWSVAALTLPHSNLLRSVAFETAFGADGKRALEKGEKPCHGVSVPTLEGLSEDYLASRGGSSSPTLTAVLDHVGPDVRSKTSNFMPTPSTDKMLEQSDPDLVDSLLGLNRALRDTYLKRKFPGGPDCAQGMATDTKLCTSQFALASGGLVHDADREHPNRVTQTPQSRLIQMVKFGNVDDKTLAIEVLKMSFDDTEGPDEDPSVALEPHTAAPNAPERFTYPSVPSGPR